MTFLSRFLGGPLERKVVDASALTYGMLYGSPSSKAGVTVDINTALRVSAVLGCCRVITEDVAQLPLKLYRERGDVKTPATEHPLYRILTHRPNDWMDPFEFRETLGLHAVLAHGGFAYINRVGGQVMELLPFMPSWVTVVQETATGDVAYDVSVPGLERRRFPKTDVFHIHGPSWNGVTGMELVTQAREAIGLAIATEEGQARLQSNGARPSGIITTEKSLAPEVAKKIKAKFLEENATVQRSFGVALFDNGLKYQQMAMSGLDAKTLETRKHQVEEVARMFRVFPLMLGYADKTATYASTEQFALLHVKHSLGPWLVRWEQAVSRDLLTEAEVEAGYFAKHNVNALLRGDAKTRADFYESAITKAKWMTRNEARLLEDMNPRADMDAPLPDGAVGTVQAPAQGAP